MIRIKKIKYLLLVLYVCFFIPFKVSESDNRRVLLYPNPTDGLLHLDLINIDFSIQKIQIFNTLGKQDYHELSIRQNSDLAIIDAGHLSSGVYYLRAYYDKNRFITKPFIID